MDKINIVINLTDAKLTYKEDKWHISGQPQSVKGIAEECRKLDGIDKVESSHLYRVVFDEVERDHESDYISIASRYDLAVGVRSASTGRIAQLGDTSGVDQYHGDMAVRAIGKVLSHTEKGKTRYYLTFYPGVIVIPEDWKDHLMDPFEGM